MICATSVFAITKEVKTLPAVSKQFYFLNKRHHSKPSHLHQKNRSIVSQQFHCQLGCNSMECGWQRFWGVVFSNSTTLSECLVGEVHTMRFLAPSDARPRGSEIFAQSDKTSLLLILDSSADRSVEENLK